MMNTMLNKIAGGHGTGGASANTLNSFEKETKRNIINTLIQLSDQRLKVGRLD